MHTPADKPLISLIIVVHSGIDFAKACIASYRESTQWPTEIIVVNNGASDVAFPEADTCIRIENHGFSHGVNCGFAQASGRYLLIANPDVVFHAGSVDSLVGYMRDNRSVGVAAPRVYSENGEIQPSARSFPTPHSFFFGRTSSITRLFPGNRYSHNVLNQFSASADSVPVDWVSACCMLVERAAFMEVRGFDEGYFLFAEDLDFCWRISQTKNWTVALVPTATICHKIGISDKHFDPEIIRHRHKSYRLFVDRYYANKHQLLKSACKLVIQVREKYQILRAHLQRS